MKQHQASFRDPSGYIAVCKKNILRVVNPIYFEQFNSLTSSGFYQTVIDKKLLIGHEVVSETTAKIVLQPERIPFVTYPYEWSFEMLKQASLLTLKLHKYALKNKFILKDASAYNITFHNGKPIFIDTLSFDFYIKDQPWRAYKQFIMHFFGPLLLAKYHGSEMFKMLQTHIDGIPLKLLSSLLPNRTKLSPIIQSNIHLLAKLEAKHSEDYSNDTSLRPLSFKAQNNLITSLYDYIKSLTISENTEWGNYYSKINYNKKSFEQKTAILQKWVRALKSQKLIDIGGNDGTFARSVKDFTQQVIVTDIDPKAINYCYQKAAVDNDSNILPLVFDVLQPSPGIGFDGTERTAIIDRFKAYQPDLTVALAVIHHLALTGNVPFHRLASFFASFSTQLIIEFPKRNDSWVTSLLSRKREFEQHFDFYNQHNFEQAFQECFEITQQQPIESTNRVLYLMKIKLT